MDIQELRYFLATYDNKSYAAAAKQLFISRQALRQKLMHLEEELGTSLFVSGGKILSPTEAGELLNKECRPVVRQFDHMEQKLLSCSPSAAGELKLAFGLGAVAFLNPDVLLNFQSRYPQIALQVMENSDSVVLGDIVAGRAALGILGASESLLNEVEAVRIQSSGLYLYVHRDNPLSSRAMITPQDLDDQGFVSFGEQNHAHWFLCKECAMYGCMPRFIFCTQDNYSALKVARKYKAITWSYPPTVVEYEHPDFRTIPLKLTDKSWGTYIISRQGQLHTPAARLLIQHMLAEAVDV